MSISESQDTFGITCESNLSSEERFDPASEGEPFSDTHSFILKFWQEETGQEEYPTFWRGRITHVTSGKQRYFQALKEAMLFILSFLNRS